MIGRPFFYGAGYGVLALVGVSAIAWALINEPRPRLIWNASESAPVGLYRVVHRAPLRGELALVSPTGATAQLIERRSYLRPETPLLKRVAAQTGDETCRHETLVFVNGVALAEALKVDSMGRPMPAWSGCLTLQDGEIFLLNEHPKSLDGRYFGMTELNDVVGVAQPVWLRQKALQDSSESE